MKESFPIDIVNEAEQIVDCYLTGKRYDPSINAPPRFRFPGAARKRFGLRVRVLAFAFCVVFASLFWFLVSSLWF